MTGRDAAADRLHERLNQDSEPLPGPWLPEPNGELIGEFEGYRSGTTSLGETHQIALVRDFSGRLFSVWLFHTVLRDEMKKAQPLVGELVAIRRLADRENGDGLTYRVYRVVVDRDEEKRKPPQGDWTFLGDQRH